jgi:putative hydrolase of the HAD superfamily
MENISAIILDLGGVLLNIDYQQTKKAFSKLGIQDFDVHYTQFRGSHLFDDLETGKVSEPEFYDIFRNQAGLQLSDEQIRQAWNAMLLEFPASRAALLADLRTRYRLFLLSNTNGIHYDFFNDLFKKSTGLKALDDSFDHAYYSHRMGLRKPGVEIYRQVLKEQHLDPATTLFIDDTEANLVGAKEAGIQTIHLQAPDRIEDLGL